MFKIISNEKFKFSLSLDICEFLCRFLNEPHQGHPCGQGEGMPPSSWTLGPLPGVQTALNMLRFRVGGGGSSFAQLCPTLWDPMDCNMAGFPVLHYLPEFAQTNVH